MSKGVKGYSADIEKGKDESHCVSSQLCLYLKHFLMSSLRLPVLCQTALLAKYVNRYHESNFVTRLVSLIETMDITLGKDFNYNIKNYKKCQIVNPVPEMEGQGPCFCWLVVMLGKAAPLTG